jgi:hypothetical protein
VQRRPPPATQSGEVIVRPLEERPAYQQNMQRYGTTPYAAGEQRPQVVRASPTNQGLQDLLVPSIETASSDAVDSAQRGVYRGYQEMYPQRVAERQMLSQPHRQVIVIDDSPPVPVKRRRVVYEDEVGRFRPVPSRDQDSSYSVPGPGSYVLPASVQRSAFPVRREGLPSQSAQGLSRDVPPSMRSLATGERIPIYGVPPGNEHFTSSPDRYRRVEDGYDDFQREGPLIKRQTGFPQQYSEQSPYTRQPVNGDMRVVEHDPAREPYTVFSSRETVQRPLPPFSVSGRVPSSNEVGRGMFVLPRARDNFTAPAQGSRQSSMLQENISPQYMDRPAETFTTLRSAGARSPARYAERPM